MFFASLMAFAAVCKDLSPGTKVASEVKIGCKNSSAVASISATSAGSSILHTVLFAKAILIAL